MSKTTARAILAAALLCSALPSLAADLILKVNPQKNSVAVTNTLKSKVTLLFLKSEDNTNLPLYAQLVPEKTVNVPLRFPMPDVIDSAVTKVDGQERFLTVEVVEAQ